MEHVQSPLAQRIVQDALVALFEATGLRGNTTTQDRTLGDDNAVLRILHGDTATKFVAEVQKTDRGQITAALKTRAHLQPHPTLLIAPYIARQTAERCREIGIQFIDGAGNAYLEMPGLFVFVAGQPRKAGVAIAKPNYQALTPTGLRLIFMLLTKPQLLNAPYRELAKAAGIAIGGVGRAIKDLELRRYLTPEGNGPRRLLAEDQLREEWAAHYSVKLRPKLHPRRFTRIITNAFDTDWWNRTDLHPYGAVWGGEVAADILTSYLRPETVTIYAHGPVEPLMTKFRLKPDPQGDIEILQAFWHKDNEENKSTAPPLLIYADLMASDNSRSIETAKLIYEQFFD